MMPASRTNNRDAIGDEPAAPAATGIRKQRYISLMRLTGKGVAELNGSAERRKLSEDRVAALGGRSIAFYATMGPYDFVQIFEMPDNAAMMEYLLTAKRDGFVEPLVLPAFDAETYGGILRRIVDLDHPSPPARVRRER